MDKKPERTQRTEQGHEIPVPKRSAWDRLLSKVAKPSRQDAQPKEQLDDHPEDEVQHQAEHGPAAASHTEQHAMLSALSPVPGVGPVVPPGFTH